MARKKGGRRGRTVGKVGGNETRKHKAWRAWEGAEGVRRCVPLVCAKARESPDFVRRDREGTGPWRRGQGHAWQGMVVGKQEGFGSEGTDAHPPSLPPSLPPNLPPLIRRKIDTGSALAATAVSCGRYHARATTLPWR